MSWEETTERGGEPSATVEDPQGASESLHARWGPVLARILAEQIGRLPARDRLLLSLYYMSEVPLKIIDANSGSTRPPSHAGWIEFETPSGPASKKSCVEGMGCGRVKPILSGAGLPRRRGSP